MRPRIAKAVKMTTKVRAYVRGYRTYRRHRPALALYVSAMEIARSGVPDAEAVEQVAALVAEDPKAAERALETTSRSVTADGDRMHRLLRAVIEGGPVAPVDPDKAPQIAEMERWRQLPLREAFRQLTDYVPELGPIGAEAEAWAAAHPDAGVTEQHRPFARLTRRVDELLEYPRESSPEPVIRSGLARSIAVEYVLVALGDRRRGDPDTTYAEISQKPFTVTISFGRRDRT